MEWKKVKLGEIADVQTGPFGSQLHNEDYVKYGSPIVTVEHLGNKRFSTQNLPCISDADKARLSKYVMREGDIIFSRVGSVDRCSYAYAENDGWLFSGRCLRVRVNNDIAPQFIYYCLEQESVKDFVKSIAVGATMPSINTALLNSIPLSVPTSISDQRRIASILSSLDAQIENNNRINANLEAQAQALFKSWFVDFEPWGGVMPEDWKEGKLGDIIEERTKSKIQVGEAKGSNGVFPFFTSGTSILRYHDYMVDGRNLFLNTGGNADVKYYIGRASYSTDTWCIAGKDNYTDWLFLYLSGMIDTLNAQYFEGSALKHLKKKNLQDRELIIPSCQDVETFNLVVAPMFDLISHNTETNARLAALRDTLLPKLMKGEIEL